MENKQNGLYPIFLKVKKLKILIVGGGNVALEKLQFLLKSSPESQVKVVALDFKDEIKLLSKDKNVTLITKAYDVSDIMDVHLVIVATNMECVNKSVYFHCKSHNILVNLADNPSYCDFYMGGIVTKGNVKIAISTNGKCPTTAKRLRQFFEEFLPDEIDELVENLNDYRSSLKDSFHQKVVHLNALTKSLITK